MATKTTATPVSTSSDTPVEYQSSQQLAGIPDPVSAPVEIDTKAQTNDDLGISAGTPYPTGDPKGVAEKMPQNTLAPILDETPLPPPSDEFTPSSKREPV
jgi:hypothetical protein